jgi:hypothetical protein
MDELELLRANRPQVEPLDEKEILMLLGRIGETSRLDAMDDKPERRPRNLPRRRVLVGVCSVLVIAVVGLGVGLGLASDSGVPSPDTIKELAVDSPETSALAVSGLNEYVSGGSSADCGRISLPVSGYWAFAGRVQSVNTRERTGGGTENVVTFAVDRWFAGSDLAAAASRPAQQEPETATVTFLQGLDMPGFGSAETRMLVAGGMDTTDAGTELVGWGCGATRAWSADAEADWLETFG